MLYWETVQKDKDVSDNTWDFLTGQVYWIRLYDKYLNGTLFGYKEYSDI
jgi:hypothetical protein